MQIQISSYIRYKQLALNLIVHSEIPHQSDSQVCIPYSSQWANERRQSRKRGYGRSGGRGQMEEQAKIYSCVRIHGKTSPVTINYNILICHLEISANTTHGRNYTSMKSKMLTDCYKRTNKRQKYIYTAGGFIHNIHRIQQDPISNIQKIEH